MHPSILHLVELQGVDARLAEVRARLATFPKLLADADKKLESARTALATSKEALTKSLKDRKTYEMDVETWKEKVRKYKDQTAAVKTNDAYKALLHEIQMAESEIAKAEDRLLDRMVAGEEYERQVKAAEKTLREAEASAAGERQKIQADQAAAEKELAALMAEREQATAHIPEDLLDNYTRIAKRHGGHGLAEVREEACALCGVRVRPHVFQELRRPENHEIYRCEGCTRILYFTEPAGQAMAAPAAAQPNQP
jgi:hypothetical protein